MKHSVVLIFTIILQVYSGTVDNTFEYSYPPNNTRANVQLNFWNPSHQVCPPELANCDRGLLITTRHVLRASESPFIFNDDVVVHESGELIVERGVQVKFAPQKGLVVRGSLTARGSPDRRILFTSQSVYNPQAQWPDVRLVDGDLPSEGRLQIKHLDEWHSVCTSSKNWSAIDLQVVCTQLGFTDGHWYQWFTKFNESRQLMLEDPGCRGHESQLQSCSKWRERQIGSGTCDYHADIGIRCSRRLSSKNRGSWSGITFLKAKHHDDYLPQFQGRLRRQVSDSVLEYVDIDHAGENVYGESSSSILVKGIPPVIRQSSIRFSAGSGINVTDSADGFVIEDTEVIGNRGFGIFVNTSWGQVNLNNVKVENNGADGVRYNLQPDLQTGDEFCRFSNLGESQVYPIRISHFQNSRSSSRDQCCQDFKIRNNLNTEARLTIHFPSMSSGLFEGEERDRHRVADGFIEVYDGYDKKLALKFQIKNDTKVPSVTSTENRLSVCYQRAILKKVSFTVVITTDFGKAYDLNITRSTIRNNNGRGVWVQDQRSGTVLNHTFVSNHSYVAGLHIQSGAGDVIVNNSQITLNRGDGMNISLSDGNRHIDRSEISLNSGRGISLWFNETRVQYHSGAGLSAQVTYSEVWGSGGVGLFMSNVCRSDSFFNISMNGFRANRGDAVELYSCYHKNAKQMTLLITHNKFGDNHRLAIRMSPVFNIRNAVIAHNLFQLHSRGVLFINSQDTVRDGLHFEDLPAFLTITDNIFKDNNGLFVASIGLLEESKRQQMEFSRNILENNIVREAYQGLNPRSRVAAVVVVSSSNTKLIRNNFLNPLSKYEIGSHLEIHSAVINASFNYFGEISNSERTSEIYDRIFDRKNRYNLAQVEFLQYRTNPYDFRTNELLSIDRERDKFIPFRKGQILGGEVRGDMTLQPGTYTVVRDIFVRPGQRLSLSQGTVLNFDQSVGMMVQGKLESIGQYDYPIKFTGSAAITQPVNPTPNLVVRNQVLSSPFTPKNSTSFITIRNPKLTLLTNESNTQIQQPSNYTNGFLRPRRQVSMGSVRLSSGNYGRLEVQIDGEWGSVCSYEFDKVDAAIACQQMGMVLNSRDWLLERSQFTASTSLRPILTKLKCTNIDTDITQCESQRAAKGDFLNSCHAEIGIKCYKPSWSGIRLGMVAEESVMEYTLIENAGQLDYATSTFKSALQVDFNRHRLKGLKVEENSDSGISFMWNDLFLDPSVFKLHQSLVYNNENHGIVSRSQGLLIERCEIEQNRGSGFHYDPMFSHLEQKDLISWITPLEKESLLQWPTLSSPSKYLSPSSSNFPDEDTNIHLYPDNRSSWYLRINQERRKFNGRFHVSTKVEHAIGIMILNPIFGDSTETLTISTPAADFIWDLKRNLSSFPMLKFSYKLDFNYSSGDNPRGEIILYFSVKPLRNFRTSNDLIITELEENKQIKTIRMIGNNFHNNGRGVMSNHYNRETGTEDEYFHRHSNETVLLVNNVITGSSRDALYVNSPFYEPLECQLAEINFTLINNNITRNQRGINQFSRDIRNSNNLFHWIVNGSVIEGNMGSVFHVRLPYVWRYNENFTHSVSLHNNSIFRNRNFEFVVDGHFSKLNMTENLFKENVCLEGLIKIIGMEKEMLIHDNVMDSNYGHFMVEFNIKSHADQFGLVPANFFRNILLRNRDTVDKTTNDLYHPRSYTIAVRGVQYINITRNLLNNQNLQFELLTGVLTGSLETVINVEENWWGYTNFSDISRRIFDFDDWNSFAIADFSPYLRSENLDAYSIPVSNWEPSFADVDSAFGGRIHQNLFLKKRQKPYVISRDLTIMPGATLSIEAGVEIEFFPSVGILVLGEMTVAGYEHNPVLMRPARLRDETATSSFRFKREVLSKEKVHEASDLTDVRLCISESCKEWDPSNKRRDGFLEVYNKTSLEWISVCDGRFTERNAEVVCRQLGYSTLNVHLKRGRRTDVGPALISRVRYWPEPLECTGAEFSLKTCDIRLNGFGNHSHACTFDSSEFVYVYCGPEPAENQDQYWGGIRFAQATFEQTSSYQRTNLESSSRLQHLTLVGAGILHGEKNAALQMVNRDISLEFVNVSSCASHAIEAVAPSGHLRFSNLNVNNNLGSGINYILLGTASTSTARVPYNPLGRSTIPYHLYGLVNICDCNKNLIVEERVLLYYKYDNQAVDCVKIFKSRRQNKQLGIRMLQFNLFNSTNFTMMSDSVRIFDGDIFNYTVKMIGDLGVSEKDRRELPQSKLYSSTQDSLSVRLHASGAGSSYGFVAEVVTIPVSYYVPRGFSHNLTFSEVSGNVLGAVTYKSAGETAPAINVNFNRFQNNCDKLFENFTTCDSALYYELQNTPSIFFENNLIKRNQGGLRIETNAQTAAGALNGFVINNLFDSNRNNEALFVRGPDIGAQQIIEVSENYFSHNIAPFKSNIVLDQVVANFTRNIVVANNGKHQMEVLGFENSFQTIRKNWFYNNFASHINERSTLFASNSGQQYIENYLVNPDNDFELATKNRSYVFEAIRNERDRERERERDRRSFIDAKNNWWGFNETSPITSRILDGFDYPDLVRVSYHPFLTSNTSVLSGICAGGWERVGHTCFTYIGARMSFKEAKRYCESQNSTMPVVKTNQRELTRYLRTQQHNYDERYFKVWVQTFRFLIDDCSVLVDGDVYRNPCHEMLPFFCEKDPDIRVLIAEWYREPLGVAVLSVSSVTAAMTLCCICCWLCKSREKAKEKMQRRNSIRASIRSNRSFASSNHSLNEIAYKRQLEKVILSRNPNGSTVNGSQQIRSSDNFSAAFVNNRANRSHSSFDSLDKQVRDEVDDESDSRQISLNLRQSRGSLEDRFAHDPALENANVSMMVHPTFDLTFENEAFRDTPSESRASEWTPRLGLRPPVAPRTGASARQAPPSPSSIGHFSRRSASPPADRFNTINTVNTYEIFQTNTLGTYERIPRREMSTFAPQLISTHYQPSVTGGSDITSAMNFMAMTADQRNQNYLETSLDGDSVRDVGYDYFDVKNVRGKYSPSASMSTLENVQPLETAM